MTAATWSRRKGPEATRLRPFFISRKTENGYFFSVEKSGRGMSFVWTGTWLS